MKQRLYFFLCGITTDISLISSRTGSLPLATAEPVDAEPLVLACPFVPFDAGRLSRSSKRRFFVAGSELPSATMLQTCWDIWLNNSIYAGPAVECISL